MSQTRPSLFPPYLNASSHGTAVAFLQQLLSGLFPDLNMEITGIHNQASVEVVKHLQRELGFTGEDVDGNFGPGTRKAFHQKYAIDINRIPVGPAKSATRWFSPQGDQGWWLKQD